MFFVDVKTLEGGGSFGIREGKKFIIIGGQHGGVGSDKCGKYLHETGGHISDVSGGSVIKRFSERGLC